MNSKWTLLSAIGSIIVADLTMSADNVIAVSAIAQNDLWLMVFGLVFSMALMGFAAHYISTLLERYQWIGYLGFLVVLFLALNLTLKSGLKMLA